MVKPEKPVKPVKRAKRGKAVKRVKRVKRVKKVVKPDYKCSKCKKVFSDSDYKANVNCPSCGVHLWRRTNNPPVKVNGVYKEFKGLTGFEVSEGIVFNNVTVWLTAKKNAYTKYRKKLLAENLAANKKWPTDFKNYLYFKHNQSWLNLSRFGSEAVAAPDQLKRVLTVLQDNSLSVEDRVRECLQGQASCPGINKSIVTGLLHTFYPAKYAPWTKQTDDALKRIKRNPPHQDDVGKNYLAINDTLTKLAAELHTNLTTLDALLWYIGTA